MGRATALFFFGPAPWGPGEGPKGQISLNFNYKVNFKDFLTKLCLLTHERYKTYQTGYSFGRLGHAPGWDLGVLWGVGGVKKNFSEIQPDLVCELQTEWHMHWRHFFLVPSPWGLGEGPKGQISLNLNYKVNFKDF